MTLIEVFVQESLPDLSPLQFTLTPVIVGFAYLSHLILHLVKDTALLQEPLHNFSHFSRFFFVKFTSRKHFEQVGDDDSVQILVEEKKGNSERYFGVGLL